MFNDFKYESKINSQCNYKRWQLLRVAKKKRVENTTHEQNFISLMMLQITRTLFKGSSREELFTNQKEDKNALNDIGRE